MFVAGIAISVAHYPAADADAERHSADGGPHGDSGYDAHYDGADSDEYTRRRAGDAHPGHSTRDSRDGYDNHDSHDNADNAGTYVHGRSDAYRQLNDRHSQRIA